MPHNVTIQEIEELSHNVKLFRTEKPNNYDIKPGEAVQVSIDKPDLEGKKRPLSFTSLNPEPYLEFIVQILQDEGDITREMDKLKVSEQLVIEDPWQAVQYKGPGIFVAYGIGITAFVAVLRRLREDDELEGHRLILAAKGEEDLILQDEFEAMFGRDFIRALPGKSDGDDMTNPVDRDFLKEHAEEFDQNFYICGPPEFVDEVQGHLEGTDADVITVVYEKLHMTPMDRSGQ